MCTIKLDLGGEQAVLLAEKALWLPNLKSLVLADVHWGKIDHFRRAGLSVPTYGNHKNTETLIALINQFRPQRLIFLGDLFHSIYNDGWEAFGQVRKAFDFCSFELVIGNHDILSDLQYERHQIQLHPSSLQLNNLILTHEPLETIPDGLYNLAGHIHPGAHLRGTGKQSVTLPCFHLKQNQGILPAFGAFTGLASVKPKIGDKIFVIAEAKVIAMNES